MIKLLDYYDVRKTIELDPATGDFEIAATQREFLYHGLSVTRSTLKEFIFHRFTVARSSFLSRYRLAAVYCLSGHIYLQIDRHRWDLDDPSIAIKNTSGWDLIRKFEVSRNNNREFREFYLSRFFLNPLNIVDFFTYDYMDAEADDFFLHLRDFANSLESRDDAKKAWSEGVRPYFSSVFPDPLR